MPSSTLTLLHTGQSHGFQKRKKTILLHHVTCTSSRRRLLCSFCLAGLLRRPLTLPRLWLFVEWVTLRNHLYIWLFDRTVSKKKNFVMRFRLSLQTKTFHFIIIAIGKKYVPTIIIALSCPLRQDSKALLQEIQHSSAVKDRETKQELSWKFLPPG